MEKLPTLLPIPRQLRYTGGIFKLSQKSVILIDSKHPENLLLPARMIQKSLLDEVNLHYEINASNAIPAKLLGITLRHSPLIEKKPQGYTLSIKDEGIIIEAQDEPGLFYGCCTFVQILLYFLSCHDSNNHPDKPLPCLEISDWPDFLNRGVMLDISRDKVPTMETLFELIDLLSSWKINQLQLYTEHTFAYHQHPEVWKDASPITGEEILLLDNYSRARYIELVPNQNSFGHLTHWLKLPEYKNLAEAPNGFDFPWGHHSGPFSLCPTNPESLDFLSGLYDELLPHFSSRQFNVGCDETFDLSVGSSKEQCEKLGTGRVYLDFLLKIHEQVRQRNFKMQFWGDIIMNYPELVSELPKDCIALEWGYEGNHPFDEHARKFAQAQIPFYVCPGTSSWNSIAGRTDNCIQNLSNAASNGLKNGAIGYLITDWGDNGHWQMLPISYLGFAAGAAYSWCYANNSQMDIKQALSTFAFNDPSNVLGSVAYDLGNIYHLIKILPHNSSILFTILQNPIKDWMHLFEIKDAVKIFNQTLDSIDNIDNRLLKHIPNRSGIDVINQEFHLTVQMLRHACLRGLYAFGSPDPSNKYLNDDLTRIVDEYKNIWLKRNRPGGLQDSLTHFDIAFSEYQ